jgi:hypothetical protein
MMRLLVPCGVLMVALATGVPVHGQERPVLSKPPVSADPAAHYVFYLHGRIIETAGRRPTHPRFGVYEYDEILDALSGPGIQVLSEVRAADTRVWEYARKVAAEVQMLLEQGVPTDHIAVVGFSKGGQIAMATAASLEEPITYVLLASCSAAVNTENSFVVSGRVLSIFEESDDIGVSCDPVFDRSEGVDTSREVSINSGLGHGAFYRVREDWLRPTRQWIRAPARSASEQTHAAVRRSGPH